MATFRSLVRVLVTQVSLVIIDGRYVCELISREALKGLILRSAAVAFDYEEGLQSNAMGWLFPARPFTRIFNAAWRICSVDWRRG